ncbi:transporter substrate-binding domain-containing protein [Streptomyces sp. NPDC046215]|uniref:Transporter substrate-binding domain-containing protein n=1 Tax=Streptomyces stramineus TaxID=173861 RepID=A0ABN1BGH3_9ACTN
MQIRADSARIRSRRHARVAGALALVLACTAGTGAAEAAGRPLAVCTTGDYQPMTFHDRATGRYSGIDIEMARELAAHLGRETRFVPTTWPTMMNDLAVPGRCDIVMGGVSVTPERQRQADFTRPYLTDGKTPLTTAARVRDFGTVAQINKKSVRVIVNPGGTNEQFVAEHLPDATVVRWPDNTTIFDELVAGRADVMITDALEARYRAKLHKELAAVHPDQPFTTVRKAYMLPKAGKLTHRADKWLAGALRDGTFRRIHQKWTGSTPP